MKTETEPRHAMTFRLDLAMYERMRREVYETNTDLTAIITEALREHYRRLDGYSPA